MLFFLLFPDFIFALCERVYATTSLNNYCLKCPVTLSWEEGGAWKIPTPHVFSKINPYDLGRLEVKHLIFSTITCLGRNNTWREQWKGTSWSKVCKSAFDWPLFSSSNIWRFMSDEFFRGRGQFFCCWWWFKCLLFLFVSFCFVCVTMQEIS